MYTHAPQSDNFRVRFVIFVLGVIAYKCHYSVHKIGMITVSINAI